MLLRQTTTKQKKTLAFIFTILLLAGGGALLAQKLSVIPTPQESLNREELAILAKPSVVRIIQHTTGQVTLPVLDMDINNLTISIASNRIPRPQKIDKYLSGSGVIINPDGYILTNAHVISSETIKQMYVEDALRAVLEDKTKNLNSSELENLTYSDQELQSFLQKSLNFVEKHSSFDFHTEISVLNPGSTQESTAGLIQNGFSAAIIDYNKNFLEDEKDVALIKIDAKNLPAANLEDNDAVATGNQIYVFGFPSTAELNPKNPLEATFTGGLISAIKFSQTKDFKIFQTDAKISQGSSGGPLLNSQGRVIGLITFETGEEARTAGDNFAFALPVTLAKDLLDKNNVPNIAGNYLTHFTSGLAYFHNNQCQKAGREFDAAKQTNQQFEADKYLNPYVQKCEELVNQGKSLDTARKQLISRVRSLNNFIWFIVGGRAVLVILIFWVFWLVFSRLQKDEQNVEALSKELEQEKNQKKELLNQLSKRGIGLPRPETELHANARLELNVPHPHIVDFITEARAIGLKDDHITEELTEAGWSQEEILRALKAML